MADEEIVGSLGKRPDVGFDTSAAPTESFKKGHAAPVVIVRMTMDRFYVPSEAGIVAFLILFQGKEVMRISDSVVSDEVEQTHEDVGDVYNATKCVSS